MDNKNEKFISVKLPEGRLSFTNLFKKVKFGGVNSTSTPEYSCSILFDDKADLSKLEKAINTLKTANGIRKLKNEIIKDGDDKDYAGYAGMRYVTVRSLQKPKVVDNNLQPIIDEEDIYSGCYGITKATVSFYDSKEFGKGVRLCVDAVMKTRDGDRLGGSVYSEAQLYEDFKDDVGKGSTESDDDLLG